MQTLAKPLQNGGLDGALGGFWSLRGWEQGIPSWMSFHNRFLSDFLPENRSLSSESLLIAIGK